MITFGLVLTGAVLGARLAASIRGTFAGPNVSVRVGSAIAAGAILCACWALCKVWPV